MLRMAAETKANRCENLLLLRVVERRKTADGMEPFTPQCDIHQFLFPEVSSSVSCAIGADRPNVRDEPRAERARRVPQCDFQSDASFQNTFGSTRRDRSARWLWRLVSRFHWLGK
jgi:hypothetical protein